MRLARGVSISAIDRLNGAPPFAAAIVGNRCDVFYLSFDSALMAMLRGQRNAAAT